MNRHAQAMVVFSSSSLIRHQNFLCSKKSIQPPLPYLIDIDNKEKDTLKKLSHSVNNLSQPQYQYYSSSVCHIVFMYLYLSVSVLFPHIKGAFTYQLTLKRHIKAFFRCIMFFVYLLDKFTFLACFFPHLSSSFNMLSADIFARPPQLTLC